MDIGLRMLCIETLETVNQYRAELFLTIFLLPIGVIFASSVVVLVSGLERETRATTLLTLFTSVVGPETVTLLTEE